MAIVLGGSKARGTHTATSDIDLGLYYDPANLHHVLIELNEIVEEISFLLEADVNN